MAFLFRKRTDPAHEESDDDLVLRLGEEIPWFGEDPYLASTSRHPPRPIIDDLEYVRRILISWLIGRPASLVAKRAGCSERTVRNVIARVVYAREEEIDTAWSLWCELGLVAGIRLPGEIADRAKNEEQIVIACQVCHRRAGEMWMSLQDDIGQELLLLDQDVLRRRSDLRDGVTVNEAGIVQGHLMCHFMIGNDPIRRPGYDRWLILRLRMGTASPEDKVRWSQFRRQSHLSLVTSSADETYSTYVEGGQHEPLPIVNGKEMNREAARRRWKKNIGVR